MVLLTLFSFCIYWTILQQCFNNVHHVLFTPAPVCGDQSGTLLRRSQLLVTRYTELSVTCHVTRVLRDIEHFLTPMSSQPASSAVKLHRKCVSHGNYHLLKSCSVTLLQVTWQLLRDRAPLTSEPVSGLVHWSCTLHSESHGNYHLLKARAFITSLLPVTSSCTCAGQIVQIILERAANSNHDSREWIFCSRTCKVLFVLRGYQAHKMWRDILGGPDNHTNYAKYPSV